LSDVARQRRRIVNEERRQGSRAHAGRQQGSRQSEVVHRDGAAPATFPTTVLDLRTQARVTPTDYPPTGRRSCSAHACRDSAVVCDRIELIVGADSRLGLTARERRVFTVRFLDGLESRLRAELTELVRRRGTVARRAAERMEPIEIVFYDPLRGLQRITGWVQPPQRRNRPLQDIQFGLCEVAS
jgi:hypothetical protein